MNMLLERSTNRGSQSTMLDRAKLKKAVDLQNRSYKLLKWLETSISKGFVNFEKAHEYTSAAEACADWVSEHYLNLPPSCRPPLANGKDREQFANLFSSYLLTSFDLVENPEKRLVSHCGCYCSFCSHLVDTAHLRPKRITKGDKNRAQKLKFRHVQQIALELGVNVSDSDISGLISFPGLREEVSMSTYGEQLILRAMGNIEGPALLVLWREFAWNQTGSPKKGFKLEAENIVQSEESLKSAIKAI